jgi:RNA polymerase sigma-70 factor (ECF subfamily)
VANVDPKVIAQARAGDPKAFEIILRTYQQRIYALAYRVVYDKELARDITQDVFLRLYQRMDRYDPSRPFEPWFFTLATHYTLNARQKALLRRTQSLDAPFKGTGDARPEPEDTTGQAPSSEAADSEARAAIHQAIRELPDKYSGIVALHYLEGLGVKGIGERLGMPTGTVKIRLHRARNLLRETLKRFRRG